jgi:hypothetical protein
MKKIVFILLIACPVPYATAQIEDFSYEYNDEKIIKNVFTVPASVKEIWSVYDNDSGFESWVAPVAEINWRRGGTIKASFTVGGTIGDPTTTTSYIVNYIPMREIVIKDELLPLLEMGIQAGWLQGIPEEFLNGLRENGSDIFTTLQFEEVSDSETKVTVYNTGYKTGETWNMMYSNALESNKWIYQKLIDRFKNGPVEWGNKK